MIRKREVWNTNPRFDVPSWEPTSKELDWKKGTRPSFIASTRMGKYHGRYLTFPITSSQNYRPLSINFSRANGLREGQIYCFLPFTFKDECFTDYRAVLNENYINQVANLFICKVFFRDRSFDSTEVTKGEIYLADGSPDNRQFFWVVITGRKLPFGAIPVFVGYSFREHDESNMKSVFLVDTNHLLGKKDELLQQNMITIDLTIVRSISKDRLNSTQRVGIVNDNDLEKIWSKFTKLFFRL